MRSWPAFRTLLGGDTQLQRWDGPIAMVVTFVVMGLLTWIAGQIADVEIAGIWGMAIFLSPVTLPLFFALGVWGLRKGYGGWAVALLVGAALSVLPIAALTLLEPDVPLMHLAIELIAFASAGIAVTGIMWITLYLRRPAAFIGPRPKETL